MSANLIFFEDWQVTGYSADYLQGTSGTVGPFPYGGALFIIAQRHGVTISTNRVIVIYKSVDNGLTWTQMDVAGQPFQNNTFPGTFVTVWSAAAHFDGSSTLEIGFMADIGDSSGNHTLNIITFDMGTGLWGPIISTSPIKLMASTGRTASDTITRLSTGDWLFTYTATTSGTFHFPSVDSAVYSAGSWSFSTLFPFVFAQLPAIISATLGPGDRVHFLVIAPTVAFGSTSNVWYYYWEAGSLSASLFIQTAPTFPPRSGSGGFLTAQDEVWIPYTVFNSVTRVKDLYVVGISNASTTASTFVVDVLYSHPEPPFPELTFNQFPGIWSTGTELSLFFGTDNDFNQTVGEFDAVGVFSKVGAGAWTGPVYPYQAPPDLVPPLPPTQLDTVVQVVYGTVFSGTTYIVAASHLDNKVYCGALVFVSTVSGPPPGDDFIFPEYIKRRNAPGN